MASSHPPPISEEELEKELKDAGNKFLKPPSSTEELLNLLDEVERLLSKVEQGPTHSMLDALQPSMKALTATEILRHTDTDVKVSVASCISEITRIMAPDTPYSDEEMKEFFELSIVAFEQLSNTCGHNYLRAVSVLRTLANIRVCVLMLDLELDELIIKMFERFLDIKSQPDAVLSDMEKIMTLIVDDSEELSFELLSVLLSSVKRENQNVSPFSWELAQKILMNCADKLVYDLPKAVSSMGIEYHNYAEIVASICQVTLTTDIVDSEKFVSDDIFVRKVDDEAEEKPRSGMNNDVSDTRVIKKQLEDCQQRSVTSISNFQQEDTINEAATQQSKKKRGRKPNSFRKEEEGYGSSQIIGVSSSLKSPCRKNPKKRTSHPSNSSALEGIIFPSEPRNEPHSHVPSVKKVPNKSLTSPPSQSHSILEKIHSSPQFVVHQKKNFDNSINTDNGLNLLSVSAGDLQRTKDEEAHPRLPLKLSESTGDSRGKRKTGPGNTASISIGDAKAKCRRALRKNEIERTVDVADKHREAVIPTKTDGICRDHETKREIPVWQFDVMVQQGSRDAPTGHGTEQPGDGFGFGGASKVKKKRKRTSLPKEKDHGEELVGRKIKVWWPSDEQFYRGVVTLFDHEKKEHKVEYIDGDEELLYLKTERWELVEDVGDSEATEDAKSGVISSANRFSSAQTNSSGPVKMNHKADSGKRTKRSRSIHDVLGKTSLAKIQTSGADHECDQVVKACSMLVDVGGYRVKAAYAIVLTAIFAKYGDIAAHCLFTSATVRTSFLEVVCDVVKRLQSNTTTVIVSELQDMENAVHDAEAAKLEVSWLRQYLDKIRGAEVGQSCSLLKDMKANTILVAKAAKRDLAQKQVELVAAQERVREAESCVNALALVAKKISQDILVREAEESAWREPILDLAMP